MKKKHIQGDYEYYNEKKWHVILWTILCFAISLAIYAGGYLTTGSNKNLLTIVAVLGLLPASKSAVSMILYLRYHGCSAENYELLKDKLDGFLHGYGFVFTTYQKNYEAAACTVKNGYICGYLTNHSDSARDLEEHINGLAKQNGLKATVVMYTKPEDFIKRLDVLREKEAENEDGDRKLYKLLCEISL